MVSFVLHNSAGQIVAHGICSNQSFELMQPKAGWQKLQIQHHERAYLYDRQFSRIAGVENGALRHKQEIKLIPDKSFAYPNELVTITMSGSTRPVTVLINNRALPEKHQQSIQFTASIPRILQVRILDDEFWAEQLTLEIKPDGYL